MSIRSVVAATRRGLLGIALCAASAADAADFTPLGSLPDPNNIGIFGSGAHAVAADGRTIAGESVVFRNNVSQRDAVLWRNDVGPTSLGVFAAFGSAATALSADGKAAIGYWQGNGVPGTFVTWRKKCLGTCRS